MALMEMQDGQPVPTSKIHFGYTDGITMPTIRGGPEQYRPDHQQPCEPWLFVLREDAENYDVPEPHELGLNGSFAVFKKVETDVVGFEDFLQSNKDRIDPELLAAKMCGRWRNGVPLALSPDTDSPAGGIAPEQLNNFGYVDADGSGDPKGIRCPVGAHIRRVNPRGQPVAGQGVPGGSNNSHRLIRRGLPYGPTYDPSEPYDGIERGMLFHFINANIENQYEFVLRQWVNDSEFAGAVRLHPKSKDPLIGTQDPAESIFVIPQANGSPPIEVTGLSSFVTTKAAAYMFLPSITAIKFIANLGEGRNRRKCGAVMQNTWRRSNRPRGPEGRVVMAETPTDVLVAGYRDIDEATKDFESLVALVRDKQVSIEGVILVTHAQDGSVAVRQTGDNLGRKGLGWGGGVGPRGWTVRAAAAGVGRRRGGRGRGDRQVRRPPGRAGHPRQDRREPAAGIGRDHRGLRRRAAPRCRAGARGRACCARWSRATRQGTAALKESLAEAMGKFSPDRTVLPIPDPNFGGTVGRTLDASVPDWTINMTPSPPEGAPNVLLVLIDDAGFGNPSTFGGPVSTPNMTRVGEQGLTYNRFHVTALCSPTRAALLTGRNHHTVGFGSIGELPGPFPGYTASVPKDCAPFVRALQGNGYSTGGFRQVAPDSRSSPGRRGPV